MDQAAYMRKRRKERREKFIQLLGGRCSNCGIDSNDLQFDHRNSRKKRYDLNAIKDGDEKVILKELKKCVLLCPDCHFEKGTREQDFINKDKKPSRHGTIWHYKSRGCRCAKCRKAMSQYLSEKKD